MGAEICSNGPNTGARNADIRGLQEPHHGFGSKIIIFGLYKKETAWLENFLWEKGYDKVIALQGDMTQDKRERAIADFKAAKLTPLIATDVASRGLDVQDVELV